MNFLRNSETNVFGSPIDIDLSDIEVDFKIKVLESGNCDETRNEYIIDKNVNNDITDIEIENEDEIIILNDDNDSINETDRDANNSESEGTEIDFDEIGGDETDGDASDLDETDSNDGDASDLDETDSNDGDASDLDETDSNDGDASDLDETDSNDGDESDDDDSDGNDSDDDESEDDESDFDETDSDDEEGSGNESEPEELPQNRPNPFDDNDRVFEDRHRLTKGSVQRLIELLDPILAPVDNRGNPLTTLEIVCLSLELMATNHFQRTQAYLSGVGESTINKYLYKFLDALVQHKAEFIRMPNIRQCRKNAKFLWELFKIPNICMGIDGSHAIFEEAPKGRGEKNKEDFLNRKLKFSLNCLITSGPFHEIYDVVCATGRRHDAGIYMTSEIKAYLETRNPRQICLGDKAFANTNTLITPYREGQEEADLNKAIFNVRHSGARTRITENTYAKLKGKWRILKHARNHVDNFLNIVTGCCILHNFWLRYERGIESDDDSDDEDYEPFWREEVNDFVNLNGHQAREALRNMME